MQPVSEEADEHGRSTVKAQCLGSRCSEGGLALSSSPTQIHSTLGRLRVTGRVVGVRIPGMAESLTNVHMKHCRG